MTSRVSFQVSLGADRIRANMLTRSRRTRVSFHVSLDVSLTCPLTHSPEQIVRKLRKADQLRADGKTVAEVIAELGISQPTYNRWRNRYGMMSVDEVKRLRALEKENARLKRLVADQALDIAMLKEVAEGNW